MKIAFTGFEPFGGETINPSFEAVKRLPERSIADVHVVTAEIPVVRFTAIERVIDLIVAEQPDAVVTVGQAGGRTRICPERVAVNVDDFSIPDNEGNQPIDEPVVAGAADAYFSTLPIKAMVNSMRSRGIPAGVSNSAGTFVCNHLFYGVQHFIVSNELPVRHGFVHIPYLPSQTVANNQPAMDLNQIIDGLVAIAEAIVEHDTDITASGGTIS